MRIPPSDIVLLLGSGPNVVECRDWSKTQFGKVVVINNAWAVRPDWDVLVHPDDFPPERLPVILSPQQSIITSANYVPLQNQMGGFVYAGGTMAFTAAYWALAALQPKVIAMLGCDMVYSNTEATHFYGKGTADPLRSDISLRSLEAKSVRLMVFAARQGCAMVNLSSDESRLMFPRSTLEDLAKASIPKMDSEMVTAALNEEERLGYFVPSGKYWKEEDRFDQCAIDALDALWLNTVAQTN